MNNYFTNIKRTVSTASCTYTTARKANKTFDSDFPKKTNPFKFANGPRFLPRLSSLVTNQSAFQHLSHAHIHTLMHNFVFLYLAQGITGDLIHQPPDHWSARKYSSHFIFFCIYRQRLVQHWVFWEMLFFGRVSRIFNSALVGSYGDRNLSSTHCRTNCSIDAEWRTRTMANAADAIAPQICSVLECLTRKGGEKKHLWRSQTVQIISHSPHQVQMQMGWRSVWCLISINSLISGSLWCLQRNMMNNSEVHVAVIAPTNRHTYACPPSRHIRPHTSSQSHKNMHIHKYKVTHMLTHSEYIFTKCALNVEC